jgi:DNA-binding XRE family transcriptional regulator
MMMKDYFEKRAARDPEFREARERLRPEYAFRRELIRARLDTGITQADHAERVGTTQSAIARLESGGAEPSFNILRRYSWQAGDCGGWDQHDRAAVHGKNSQWTSSGDARLF